MTACCIATIADIQILQREQKSKWQLEFLKDRAVYPKCPEGEVTPPYRVLRQGKHTCTWVIDEGPSRGRRARRYGVRGLSCLLWLSLHQHQEMVGQEWGKHQVVFRMVEFMASWHHGKLWVYCYVRAWEPVHVDVSMFLSRPGLVFINPAAPTMFPSRSLGAQDNFPLHAARPLK